MRVACGSPILTFNTPYLPWKTGTEDQGQWLMYHTASARVLGRYILLLLLLLLLHQTRSVTCEMGKSCTVWLFAATGRAPENRRLCLCSSPASPPPASRTTGPVMTNDTLPRRKRTRTCRHRDSNTRPSVDETNALPLSYGGPGTCCCTKCMNCCRSNNPGAARRCNSSCSSGRLLPSVSALAPATSSVDGCMSSLLPAACCLLPA